MKGSNLSGKVQIDELKLDTEFGPIALTRDRLRSIQVNPFGGGFGMGGMGMGGMRGGMMGGPRMKGEMKTTEPESTPPPAKTGEAPPKKKADSGPKDEPKAP